MSKNFKGYLGDQIGKLGTAVGRKWKRKMVYSAYQGKVKNPNTEGQQTVRARFALLGRMAASFLDATKKGMAASADRYDYTESDHFVKRNWDAVTATEPGEVEVDFGALTISEGRLPEVYFEAPSFAEEAEVSVAFDGNIDADKAKEEDQVYIFVYQPDSNRGILSKATSRNAGSVSVVVPARWSGMEVHVYGFVIGGAAENKGMPSDSTYIGHGNIA